MKKILDIIVTVSIIIATCAILVVAVKDIRTPHTSSYLEVGHNYHISQVSWGSAQLNIVLFLRPDCIYCQKSEPFYRHLLELAQKSEGRVRLIAVMPVREEQAQSFLKAQHLDFTIVHSVSPDQFPVPGTPTLAIIDQRGEISELWEGLLPSSVQCTVERKMSFPC